MSIIDECGKCGEKLYPSIIMYDKNGNTFCFICYEFRLYFRKIDGW